MHLNRKGPGDLSAGGAGAEEAPTLRMGEIVAEKYRLDRLLGMGGMAEVYAATNLQTEKRVALKWVLPRLASSEEGRARLRREAQAAGRIHHPNVVTIFDVVEHQGSLCLVMELLEGETLASRLARSGPLPFVEALALFLPAMRGVAAAHERGVIHRDLKPDNIFICLDANLLVRDCKVLDFGVSKLTESDTSGRTDITLAGNLVGTPAYMSPEQVRGSRTFDARVDVYALGVVLYEMLAGHPPFGGETYSAVMIEVATSDAPPLASIRRDVPRRIAQVIHRALERDLRLRFPDVLSFIRDLEEAAREDLHLPFGTPPEGLITQISLGRPMLEGSGPSRASPRRRARLLMIVLAAGAGLGLIGWRRWQHGRAARTPTESLARQPAQAPGSMPGAPGPPGVESTAVESASSGTVSSQGPAAEAAAPADSIGAGANAGGGNRRAGGEAPPRARRGAPSGRVDRPASVERATQPSQASGAENRAAGTPAAQTPGRRPRAGKLSIDDF